MRITRIGVSLPAFESRRTVSAGHRIINASRPASLFSLASPFCFMVVENPHLPSFRKEILDTIKKHNPGADLTVVEKAVALASAFHNGKIFTDGEPVIYHMCRISKQLADWKLPPEVVAAGVLTDSPARIINELGNDRVRELISKKNALESFRFNVQKVGHRKKFMKFALVQESDPQVHLLAAAHEYNSLVKRTENSQNIAARAFYVTSPLLTLVGMTEAGRELENLAFFYLSPEEAARAEKIFKETTTMDRLRAMDELKFICAVVDNRFISNGINAELIPDTKFEASLSKKAKSGERLTDLMRFRVLVKTEAECYDLVKHLRQELYELGFVDDLKEPAKDYIADPKSENGYRSLHYHFVEKNTRSILAVQIRTHEMHADAEYGPASHWKYKNRERFGRLPEFQISPEAVEKNIAQFIKALSAEGRIYAFDQKGDLQRLIQNQDNPVTFWDLSIFGDIKQGPYCPRFVTIERINSNGRKERIQVTRNTPVQNGDRLLPLDRLEKKLGNPRKLGTLLGSKVVSQLKQEQAVEDVTASQIEEKGEALCEKHCGIYIENIRELSRRFIRAEARTILFSRERLAKKLGLRSIEDLYFSFVLLGREDLRMLGEKAGHIISESFIVYDYDRENNSLSILTRGRRGVVKALLQIFKRQNIAVRDFNAKLLEEEDLGYIKIKLDQEVENVPTFEKALQEIYKDVSDTKTIYDLTRKIILSFEIPKSRMNAENILDIIGRVLDADLSIEELQAISPQPKENARGQFLFILKVPHGRNISASIRKLKRAVLRNPNAKRINISEKIELLPQ